MYDLYKQINEFITPEDTVICLGDCGDRGPDGWKIISEIADNPQWIHMKGNHEDMLAKAILSYYNEDYSEDYALLCYNGGSKTYADWGEQTNWDADWGKYLKNLPWHFEYLNDNKQMFYLSHAGYNLKDIGLLGKPLTEQQCLWDRNHINYLAPWHGGEQEFVIHGHTPQRLASKGRAHPELLVAERYAEGHKINLDCASWYTGAAILLNLDTLEEHLFLTEPLKN
jgi:hypothetical protein